MTTSIGNPVLNSRYDLSRQSMPSASRLTTTRRWPGGDLHVTAKQEASSEHPWSLDDAPSRCIEGRPRAVVGVIRGLRERGETAMAKEVERPSRGRAGGAPHP